MGLTKRGRRGIDFARRAECGRDKIQIKKLDREEQVVFGEVYAPGFPDSQGDFMAREEVKKACYNFMRKGNLSNIDTNHSQQPNGSYVVENFIARDDDSVFIPGSWVMGVKVPDRGVWQMVKSGELNGFSLDGYGTRRDAASLGDRRDPGRVRVRFRGYDRHDLRLLEHAAADFVEVEHFFVILLRDPKWNAVCPASDQRDEIHVGVDELGPVGCS